MQQYADIYLLLNSSTCFGRPSGKQAAQITRSVPEAATTVLCTPDDGRDGRPKHVEEFSSK